MKKEYTTWFAEARDAMSLLMGDSKIADAMIQHNVFSSIWSCFETTKDDKTLKQLENYLSELMQGLFDQLRAGDMFDEKQWKVFLEYSTEYTSFLDEYNFPYNLSLRETGTVLLQKIDELAEMKVNDRMRLMRPLANYYAWNDSFFWVYGYQYWNKNPCPVRYEKDRLSRFEYCEFRMIENYIEKISGLSVEEKIEKLTRQFCATEFDEKFPDQETFFLDMVGRGILVPEAIKILKTVRRSNRELTDSMEKKLRNAGYVEADIYELKKVKYLKSRNTAITMLLYVQELL